MASTPTAKPIRPGANAHRSKAPAAAADPGTIRRPAPNRSAQCPANGARTALASSDAERMANIHCCDQRKLVRDGRRQDAVAVEERAIANDLGHAQCPDRGCRNAASAHAAASAGLALAPAPHPQPDLPSLLAVASATQQASTDAGAGPPQQPSAAAFPPAMADAAANAGLGKHQANVARRFMIAGDVGNDRAHLLVAGRHQKRRRASIGFRADDDEAWFGMGEFGDAMRRHGAAGVEIRIDQRRQSSAALRPPDRARRAARAGTTGRVEKPVATTMRSTSSSNG